MCPFCRGAMRLVGLDAHPTLKTYQCIDCEAANAIDGDTSYFEWLMSRPKSKGTGTFVINWQGGGGPQCCTFAGTANVMAVVAQA
jgi:hypothetical protein